MTDKSLVKVLYVLPLEWCVYEFLSLSTYIGLFACHSVVSQALTLKQWYPEAMYPIILWFANNTTGIKRKGAKITFPIFEPFHVQANSYRDRSRISNHVTCSLQTWDSSIINDDTCFHIKMNFSRDTRQ